MPLASSVTSVTLVAYDKGYNEMTPGAVHRSPGICLMIEEIPGKPQLKKLSDVKSSHLRG